MTGTVYDSLPRLDSNRQMIRVLDLEPETDKNQNGLLPSDQPLSGQIRVVSLRNYASYTALSYVWGGSVYSKATIRCGNQSIEITETCSQALRHLRYIYGPITIWVDSICIDQANQHEKSEQIPLMDEIYSRAKSVYLWLGTGDQQSDSAMQWLSLSVANDRYFDIVELKSDPSSSNGPLQSAVYILKLWWVLHRDAFVCILRLCMTLKSERQRLKAAYDPKTMAALLGRPWFTRAWIFQEVLLSTKAVVICGTKRIVWTEFLIAVQTAQSIAAEHESQNTDKNVFESIISLGKLWINLERPIGNTYHTYAQLAKQRDMLVIAVGLTEYAFFVMVLLVWVIMIDINPWRLLSLTGCVPFFLFGSFILLFKQGHSEPWIVGLAPERLLPYILSNMRSRDSSHPSDRVFAFYGILKRARVVCQQYPDYSKPFLDVYREFASDLLQNHKSLGVLAYAEMSEDQSLPSWVPNWVLGPERISMAFEDEQTIHGSRTMHATLDNGFLTTRGIYLADICDSFFMLDEDSISWARSINEELVSHAEPSKEFLDTVKLFWDYIDTIKDLGYVRSWCVARGGLYSPNSIFYSLNLPLRSADDVRSALFDTLEHRSPSVYRSQHIFFPGSELELSQDVQRLRLSHLRMFESNYYQVKPTRAFNAWWKAMNDPHWSVKVRAHAILSCPLARQYHIKLCKSIVGYGTLFITSDNRLGIGSQQVLPGDKIFDLSAGCPLVLRPQDYPSSFKVAGSAFVHGFMGPERNGEIDWKVKMVKSIDRSKLREEDIIIH